MRESFARIAKIFRQVGPQYHVSFLVAILLIMGGAIHIMVGCGVDPEAAIDSEFRGLWVVRTSMKSQASIEQVIERAYESNFNALLVQVNGRGEAYYESEIVPKMPDIPEGFDPLAFCIRRAHAVGIEVHAWINAFTVGQLGCGEYQDKHVLTQHPEWSLVDHNQVSTLDYTAEMGRDELVSVMLDPAIEGVKEYVRNVFMEVAANYDVDGVHFDYIRYPGRKYGYSDEARDEFRKLTGYDPLDLVKKPETLRGEIVDGEDLFENLSAKWDEFRREQVTEVVRRVWKDIKRTKPDVAVSCAVFPDVDDSYNRRMQDWRGWIQEGIVDFVVPMAYTQNTQRFTGHIQKAVEMPPGRKALAGVGVYLMLEDPAGCIEKIEAARDLEAPGVVLFSYDSIKDRTDYWEALTCGPFNRRAVAPTMTRPASNRVSPASNPVSSEDRASAASSLLARMSVEEKVGQMVMAGFPGMTPGSEVETLLKECKVGGIIFFARNLSDPFQTASLSNELQKMAASQGAGVPLFISADQEGGYVARLPGATSFPGNMGLGAAGDPTLVRKVGEVTARELRACGINMNFAPAVDVNSNPSNPVIGVRSFGESADAVAELGVAMVQGLQKEGVSATVKHFPGHGDTSLDSHIALPTVPHDKARLKAIELKPFQAAIDAGVDVVMTAHVTFPAFEPEPGLPATLSRSVLTGLLREDMGFTGLIVTDAMEMGAIVKNFGLEEAAVMAVNAGADIVLVGWPQDWRDAVRVVDALNRAVTAGEIPMSRVDESVQRVLQVKERRGILSAPLIDEKDAKSSVSTEDSRKLALEAARKSICLVRDEKGLIPLNAESCGKVLVVYPNVGALTQAEDPSGEPTSLARCLKPVLGKVDEISMSANPNSAEQGKVVAKAKDYDTVIILTSRAWSSGCRGQASVVATLAEKKPRVIAVSLREPYDLKKYGMVGTYLAAFNSSGISMKALAEVLTGDAKPQAKLPVSIPGFYPAGHGL